MLGWEGVVDDADIIEMVAGVQKMEAAPQIYLEASLSS